MGLVKRGSTWWMSFMYQGQQVRRSTGTTDKRLAEAILGNVRGQIVEGRFFDRPKEQERTLMELLDRYLSEHAARRANHYRELTSVKNLKVFFGNPTLDQLTPNASVLRLQRTADLLNDEYHPLSEASDQGIVREKNGCACLLVFQS